MFIVSDLELRINTDGVLTARFWLQHQAQCHLKCNKLLQQSQTFTLRLVGKLLQTKVLKLQLTEYYC